MPRKKSAQKRANKAKASNLNAKSCQVSRLNDNDSLVKSIIESDSEDTNDEKPLKVNKEFAARYQYNKEREELKSLEKSFQELTDSSSSEEEDEDASLLTPAVDSAIMRTILLIKANDKSIYDKQTKLFENMEQECKIMGSKTREKPIKPMKIQDYQKLMLLSSQETVNTEFSEPSHARQQEILRENVKTAFANAFDDQQDDDFLLKKTDRKAEDTKDYAKQLISTIKNPKELKLLQEWTDLGSNINPQAKDKDEKFLINYILNKEWCQKTESFDVKNSDTSEEFEEKLEEFESNYNFRYLQPGATEVTSHPRNVQDTIRRQDLRRQQERMRTRKRKLEEKNKKVQDLNRLKNLKYKEIQKKIDLIKEVSGADNVNDIDLDADFESEMWDYQMSKLFDKGYYSKKENKKPKFDDSQIDLQDIDASPPSKVVQENKNTQDVIQKLMDQKYQYDYEDVITGNLPTRFKYAETKKENFGLDILDILNADDKQLNEFISLKKLSGWRSKDLVKRDKQKYGKKKRLLEWRKKVFGKQRNLL